MSVTLQARVESSTVIINTETKLSTKQRRVRFCHEKNLTKMLAVFKPGNLLNGFNKDITIQNAKAHLSILCIFESLPPIFFLRAKAVTQVTP